MKKNSYDIDPASVSPQTAARAQAEEAERAAEVKETRKQSRLAKASFAWTVISMAYAIISGAVLISGKWILTPYSYIMAGLLAVYVVIFIAVVAFYATDVKKGKKQIKTFKKLFGMFKIFTTLVFLIATAMSMAGVVDARGTGLFEWIVLGVNIFVAAVQLTLKIWLFILGIVAKRVGKKYTVKVQTYVNGKVKEHKAKSAVMSKFYGTEVTETAAADADDKAARTEPAEPETKKFKVDKDRVRELAAQAAGRLSEKAGETAEKLGRKKTVVETTAPEDKDKG